MGLKLRKSIQICKGVRINLSKEGASLSLGVKGLRKTIHMDGSVTSTYSIPGTGISYRTSSKSKSSSTSSRSGGYTRGRSTSTASQKRAEAAQKKLSEIEQNKYEVAKFNENLDFLKKVHTFFDESTKIDWVELEKNPAPFNKLDTNVVGPKEQQAIEALNNYEPGFFAKLFGKAEKVKAELEKDIIRARDEDVEDYEEWQNLHDLAIEVNKGNPEAYLAVVSNMEPFADMVDIGSNFEVGSEIPKTMEVEFKVNSHDAIPQEILSLTSTNKISKKAITKTMYNDLYQDYTCSCIIRVARELFALLPIDSLIVHACDDFVDSATGHNYDDTVVSVKFGRREFLSINFNNIDPSDAIENFNHEMSFQKLKGFSPVGRLKF